MPPRREEPREEPTIKRSLHSREIGTKRGEAPQPDLPSDIPEQCRLALQALRGALIEALGIARVDLSRPRHAARELGLDKNLMWRLSKILGQPDVFQVVSHIPHRAGMEMLCKALRNVDVPDDKVARIEAAFVEFDKLVTEHGGDRATFELLVASFSRVEHQGRSLEQGRKLAFRGNSAVWSAQARVQLSTLILFPNPENSELIDAVHVHGLIDLQSLRSDIRWTLAHRRAKDASSTNMLAALGEPLDPNSKSIGAELIGEFSSDPPPELTIEQDGDEVLYVLADGVVGRTGGVTALLGARHRGLQAHANDVTAEAGQMIVDLLTPAEHLHVDVLVHEDLDWVPDPQPSIYSRLGRGHLEGSKGVSAIQLPFTETVFELGRGISSAETLLMPWYRRLLESLFKSIEHAPSSYSTFRFEMVYPPIPAQVVLTDLLSGQSAKGAVKP